MKKDLKQIQKENRILLESQPAIIQEDFNRLFNNIFNKHKFSLYELKTIENFEKDFNSARNIHEGLQKAFDNLPDDFFGSKPLVKKHIINFCNEYNLDLDNYLSLENIVTEVYNKVKKYIETKNSKHLFLIQGYISDTLIDCLELDNDTHNNICMIIWDILEDQKLV